MGLPFLEVRSFGSVALTWHIMTAAGATSSAVRNDYIPEGDLRVRIHAGGRSLELARHLLLPPRAQHCEELILTVERLAWEPHLRNVPVEPAGQLEMDVGCPVRVLRERIAGRLDRLEPVPTLGIGHCGAVALEVRIERRG